MTTENPVYLKLENFEARKSKRSILSTEMLLLNIIKTIKNYKQLREEEFILRMQMYKLIKETNLEIRKTRSSFPFIKLPEKQKIEELKYKERKKIERKEDMDLEFQLKEIQERLMKMSS
ncbi:MAG: hypothetical protein WC511_05815 [Candidatus Pacearchaeota archaeon]